MPIDPDFQAHRHPEESYGNLKVWRDNKGTLGIYGTSVTVDFDLCVGDGACIDVCPADVFEWHGEGAERKAMPERERDCTYCFGCEAVCPKFAIRVTIPLQVKR
ncbi:ferredoxin [Candidatus Nitrososphaera evergladensis SR1]|uniref:Ferredoxin n=1 Tax=Candidatus Nitrososphaera evergladensis SR1 TaxID=1459636 RepID=A0A075MZT5_9ARCH|nr:ferredoxin family protein [Candidatus Nitrososphaera evergladensis]AIF84744.1 ferredoxin [Candidatus Nitrososphaera evergladensis SR1]